VVERIAVGLVVVVVLLGGLGVGAESPGNRDDPSKLTVVTTSAHCDWTWGHTRAWLEER